MGQITVITTGSFESSTRTFSAAKNGHASAAAKAISYLSDEVLPKAIANDHQCHADGAYPTNGFCGALPRDRREKDDLRAPLESLMSGQISIRKVMELIEEWREGKPFSPFAPAVNAPDDYPQAFTGEDPS